MSSSYSPETEKMDGKTKDRKHQTSRGTTYERNGTVKKKRWTGTLLVLLVLSITTSLLLGIQIPNAITYLSHISQIKKERSQMRKGIESLGLTEEQMNKYQTLLEKYEDGMRNPEFREAFDKILTPEQVARMHPRDHYGHGRMRSRIIENLNLTKEQEQKRIELENRFEEGMRDPGFWPELEKILTDKQKETLRTGLEELENTRRERGGAGSFRH